MLNNHDTFLELRRQLEVVRRRTGETIRRLAEAEGGLTADGLEGVAAATWAEGRGDLFQLCVRLEVALAESGEAAGKLTRRLNELSGGAVCDHWVAEQPPPGGQTFGWQN